MAVSTGGERLCFLEYLHVETTSAPVAESRRFSGKVWLALGIGLLLLGPALYVIQFQAKVLTVPWYAPALATVGVVMLLLAVLERPTVWRIAALTLVGLLTAAEWYILVWLSRVPAYTGPVAAGVTFPAFRTALADGSVFDQDSLRGQQNTALVFFRGRW
jgi:FtsH-binding integral membrane protein